MQKGTAGAKKYMIRKKRRQLWRRVVMSLACVVVFCTVYALILPAIAMEKCGMEEHTHSTECYTQTLICGLEESEEHVHTDDCYESTLSCGLEEHAHTSECYEQPEEAEPESEEEPGADDGASVEGDEEQSEDAGAEEGIMPLADGVGTRAAGVTPAGSVINVFDYWIDSINEGQHEGETWTKLGTGNSIPIGDRGINEDHGLKFNYQGLGTQGQSANAYTGENLGAMQELVRNELVGGYPQLSGNTSYFSTRGTGQGNGAVTAGDDINESLAYLFDPDATNSNRRTYTNVGGLLQVNKAGYYEYDSQNTYAYLCETGTQNSSGQQFTLTDGVAGKTAGFFPFNEYNSNQTSGDNSALNHYLGMTMTTRFTQDNQGFTDSTHQQRTTFEFSGDDDVWIFVDGVLVADLGGIHDRVAVEIDFAAGSVTIDKVLNNNGSSQTTYFESIFNADDLQDTAAGVRNNGRTLKDESYHTLKFFYLERGASASNLWLKYNLKSIPTSSIVKVDQYGGSVSGAEFALYTAQKDEGTGKYRYKVDGDNRYVSLDETISYTIDEITGMITLSGGGTITPIYYGETDGNGNMIFLDEDEMPLTLSDLSEKGGDTKNFILMETKIPSGYRQVSNEIWLYLDQDCLFCDNTFTSGAWSAATAQIAANTRLYLNDTNAKDGSSDGIKPDDKGNYYVDYYTPGAEGGSKGTLFAVVLKYNGGKTTTDLEEQKNWVPIYGNDFDGYEFWNVANTHTRDDYINAVIAMAREINSDTDKYGKTVFTLSASGSMEVLLEHLPGDIKSYYSRIYQSGVTNYNDIVQQLGYTVAYYWSYATSLDGATAANTYRVNAEAIAGVSDGFDRTFGATIEVTNLVNRLAVQKYDEEGNPVNGAGFALYRADEATNQYVASDNSLVTLTEGSYTIDADTGVITTSDSETIIPVNTAYTTTAGLSGAKEDGSVLLGGDLLTQGAYYVREFSAPAGYTINSAEVMVFVDENGVYANAGTADDGVSVARGPGYLAYNLQQFATHDGINNTLTYVYQQMRVSGESTSFGDLDNWKNWKYLKENKSIELTGNEADALKVHLEYAPGDKDALFNYAVNDGYYGDTGTTGISHRLVTDIGWSYYEIFQDYEYLLENAYAGAAYKNLGTQEIANLFSRSTFIQVTDEKISNLEISKTVVNNSLDAGTTDNTSFTFNVKLYNRTTTGEGTDATNTDTSLTKAYSYKVYDSTGNEVSAGDDKNRVITDGEGTITLSNGQKAVIENLPYNAYYTVTETEVKGYATEIQVTGDATITSPIEGTEATGQMVWNSSETEGLQNTVTLAYTNTYTPPMNLTIEKVSSEDNNTKLGGAEFVLYYTTGTGDESVYYYYRYTENDGTTWETLGEDETIEELALTTSSEENETEGKLTFYDVPNGTYYLKEIKAPDGYNLLNSAVTITVVDGKVDSANGGNNSTSYVISDEGLTVIIPNSTGIELPSTGGIGTSRYIIAGLMLMFGSACFMYKTKKRGKGANQGTL